MRWTRVDNNKRQQPTSGDYPEWKPSIAIDCGSRCIYCAIVESRFGGLRNFHVEHFRPKGNPKFSKLRKTITNLYLACSICNSFKGDDWPGEPVSDCSTATYLDPAEQDFNAVLVINESTFKVSSETAAGNYMIQRMYLNRPQLIAERNLFFKNIWLEATIRTLHRQLEALLEFDDLNDVRELLVAGRERLEYLEELRAKLLSCASYTIEDVTRNC